MDKALQLVESLPHRIIQRRTSARPVILLRERIHSTDRDTVPACLDTGHAAALEGHYGDVVALFGEFLLVPPDAVQDFVHA